MKKINQGLYLLSVCLLVMALGLNICLLLFPLFWFFPNWLAYLLFFIFVGLQMPLFGIFYFWQRKGKQLYQAYLDEVEQRRMEETFLKVSWTQARLLKSFETLGSFQTIRLIGLIYAWFGLCILPLPTWMQSTSWQPVPLKQKMQTLADYQQQQWQRSQQKVHHLQELLVLYQGRIAKKHEILQNVQTSAYEQEVGLALAQGFAEQLEAMHQSIQARQVSLSIQQLDSLIRADGFIYSQVKGMLEVQIRLANSSPPEEEASEKSPEELAEEQLAIAQKADSLLSIEGGLLREFQHLKNRYQLMLARAQTSLLQDQQRIDSLQEQTVKMEEKGQTFHAILQQEKEHTLEHLKKLRYYTQEQVRMETDLRLPPSK